MTIFGILLLFFCGFYIWWFHLKTPGLQRNQEDIEHIIGELLERGLEDGYVIFTHSRTKTFLQFFKYSNGNKSGITLSLPIVEWSKPYIQPIEELLNSSDEKMVINKETGSDGTTFIEVDFLQNIKAASTISKEIFNGVFCIPKDELLNVRLMNCSLE